MNQEIGIRAASREDLKRVYEIEKACFKSPYPFSFLDFLYNINLKTFLVAEKSGTVVGFVIASAEKGLGRIISIATHPTQRKREIGRMLMTEVLKVLVALGMKVVRLEVRKSNIEAQRFYEFLGFKSSHTVDKYYGDEDALVYFKLI